MNISSHIKRREGDDYLMKVSQCRVHSHVSNMVKGIEETLPLLFEVGVPCCE